MVDFSDKQLLITTLLTFLVRILDSACTLPSELIGQWIDVRKDNSTVTFTETTLTGWPVTIAGEEKSSHTCVSNTSNVYVFRGDETYNNLFGDLPYYFCMKLTKHSDDLFYYYLLSDTNPQAKNERIWTPTTNLPDSTTPTCDHCIFTTEIPNVDYRELRKADSTEILSSIPSLCLPCESTCLPTTTEFTTGTSSSSVSLTFEHSANNTTPSMSTTQLSSSSISTEHLTSFSQDNTPKRTSTSLSLVYSTDQASSNKPIDDEDTTVQSTSTASPINEVISSQSHHNTTSMSESITSQHISTITSTKMQPKVTTVRQTNRQDSTSENKGLSTNSVLLIVSASTSGFLLGSALITFGLCLMRKRFNESTPRARRHISSREINYNLPFA